jgi:uncharacterized protein (UPF0276 family)
LCLGTLVGIVNELTDRQLMIRAGISLIPDKVLLEAAYPLFEEGAVDAIEWAIDMPRGLEPSDMASTALVDEFSEAGALYGHGVRYSLCSSEKSEHHDSWCEQLAHEVKARSYRHLTEHFGLMVGGNFHFGAPMPLPLSDELLQVARSRFARLKEVYDGPIGIENLALALNIDEVKQQGDFLRRIVEPAGGFVLLDLHNIFCQAVNFRCRTDELVRTYPLDLVREIHISGGSWAQVPVYSGTATVRCDTHDGRVPPEVFQVLAETIARTPSLEVVILEQLPAGLTTANEQAGFREDFREMQRILNDAA